MSFQFKQEVIVALIVFVVLKLVDIGLGVLLAVAKGEFDVRKLANFLRTTILPIVGSLALLASVAGLSPAIEGLFWTAVGAAYLKLMAEIKDKLIAIYGQLDFSGSYPKPGS